MRFTRRDALEVGLGIVAGAIGMKALGGVRVPRLKAAPGPILSANARNPYGHGIAPPAQAGPLSLDGLTRPPASPGSRKPEVREFGLDVMDQTVQVALNQGFAAWTFGGSVPGPVLRATEGDEILIRLRNRSAEPHNLHFHGRHELASDGWEPVPPGGETSYRFTAGPFGVHPYHCDMTPSADHVANGLYGMLIVDPPGGRPPAVEICLLLSGFDLDGDAKSELFAWNGLAGFYAKYPIKVPAGDLVRVYLVNLVGDEPVASFHLHAETFDLYRSGTGLVPGERTDIVTLGPAERAILEFRLPTRGRYMFHPHQRRLAENGAMGWFAAV